jgi:hypothetical protein
LLSLRGRDPTSLSLASRRTAAPCLRTATARRPFVRCARGSRKRVKRGSRLDLSPTPGASLARSFWPCSLCWQCCSNHSLEDLSPEAQRHSRRKGPRPRGTSTCRLRWTTHPKQGPDKPDQRAKAYCCMRRRASYATTALRHGSGLVAILWRRFDGHILRRPRLEEDVEDPCTRVPGSLAGDRRALRDDCAAFSSEGRGCI